MWLSAQSVEGARHEGLIMKFWRRPLSSAAALATAASAALATTLALAPAAGAQAGPARAAAPATPASRACPPRGSALSFSDNLDKLVDNGVELGGTSSLAFDPRSRSWVSSVDNHGTDPERLWFFRNLASPHVVRDPLVLRKPDGTPYDGTTSDNEGLAVLPDGDYLVSSETEPSIRIYDRAGVQIASLPVPARFAVVPNGESTANATFEGLTVADGGDRIIASMEGALAGDSDATVHRILTYDKDKHG